MEAIAGSVVSSVIGGAMGGSDSSAQDAQIAQNAAAQKFLEDQTAIARQDIENIFPIANQNLLTGFAGASDILKLLSPTQLLGAQSGNVAAQQALLTGQDQFTNTILGLPQTTTQQPVTNPVTPEMFAAMLQGLPGPTTGALSGGGASSGLSGGGFVTDVRDVIETDTEDQPVTEARGGEEDDFLKALIEQNRQMNATDINQPEEFDQILSRITRERLAGAS